MKNRTYRPSLLCFFATLAIAPVSSVAETAPPVLVNGRPLTAEIVSQLQSSGIRVIPGRYWYDKISGAWGLECQGTFGFVAAGLELGGPLRADASCGDTGIFFNNRQLHRTEQQFLQQLLGFTIPGRYWFDAQGNVGNEGGPAVVNLFQAYQRQQQSNVHYYNDGQGTHGMFSSGCSSLSSSQPGGGYATATIGCD